VTEGGTVNARVGDGERGATSVEYGLIASLVAVLIVMGVMALGTAATDNLCRPIEELRAVGQDVEGCD
jgi:Flp pilus assembly pilin Flp